MRILRLIGIGFVLALILAVFLARATLAAYENVDSSLQDQSAYLSLGLQIRHHLALTDGSRHPLYPFLLTPIAHRELDYFTTAKLISILIGLAGLLAIYAVARRCTSQSGALAVTLMMALNEQYGTVAGYVNVEVLLVPLTFVAWYWAGKANQSFAGRDRKKDKYAMVAGCLAGLVYLAKGTGVLLVMAVVAAWIWIRGLAFVKHKTTWYFAAGFSIIAMPLWIYNLARYGNPFFNVNTFHIVWLDQWENRYVYSPLELPTFATYIKTHTIGEIWGRLVYGIAHVPNQWYGASRLFWFPPPSASWVMWSSLGIGLLVLVVLIHRASQRWQIRREWFLFSLAVIIFFYLSFAWYYPVSDAYRFILPLVPVLYLALLWLLQEGTASFHRAKKWISGALTLVCLTLPIAYLIYRASDLALLTRMQTHDQQVNERKVCFMKTLLQHTRAGEHILLGPDDLPRWIAFDREALRIPYLRQDWYSFNTWLATQGVRHAVLDHITWERRTSLLSQYWKYQDGLFAAELPPGWDLIEPAASPCAPCLFTFDAASLEPEHPLSVQYDDIFTLIGYDVDPDPVQAGQPWRVTAYWRVLRPFKEGIHVFVHVLEGSGTFIGQHDSQMIQGQILDHELLPGTIVWNSHPLPPLTDGTYSLRIGLYWWDNQARLSAVQEGKLVPDAYPEAGEVAVRSGDH